MCIPVLIYIITLKIPLISPVNNLKLSLNNGTVFYTFYSIFVIYIYLYDLSINCVIINDVTNGSIQISNQGKPS